MNKEEIEKVISEYRRKNLGTPELYEFVKKDLEYGISKEQVDVYMKNHNINTEQKKVYSYCLRKGYPEQLLHLMVETTDEECRTLIEEYYAKGMTVEQIKEILEQKPETPAALRKMFQNIYAELSKFTENESYNQELLSQFQGQIDAIIRKFESQEEKISQMYQTIAEHKNDAYNEETERLLKQIAELEDDLEKERNTRSDQTSTIIQLRNERNGLNVSLEHLKEKIQKKDVELKIEREKVGQLSRQLEEKEENQKGLELKLDKEVSEQIVVRKDLGQETTTPLVAEYSVTDSDGNSYVFVREAAPKKQKSPATTLFKRLFLSKRSNRYLMKKVIQTGLDEGQIRQVATGIGKGLSYEQLDILIESKATPEKMSGIIELAVLENSLEVG